MTRPTHRLADGSMVFAAGLSDEDLSQASLIDWSVLDLEAARARKWAEVKTERERRQYLTFTLSSGAVLQCDRQARDFIDARAVQAQTTPAVFPIQFRLADNSEVSVTAAQMIAVKLELAAFDGAIFEAGDALRQMIFDPAKTQAQVEGIDHTAGWP